MTDDAPAQPEPVAAHPGRVRAWRVQVGLGAVLLLAGWATWPALHVTQVYRPLRHVQGSPYTLGLAVTVLVAAWLLTAQPEPRPARAHRIGGWALRITAALAAGLTGLTWLAHDQIVVIAIVAWLAWPVLIILFVLGFGYLGRLHRLVGQSRMANLADLMGLELPVLWVGSQLVAGYPGPYTWGPGVAGMAVAGVVMLALLPGVLRYQTRSSLPAGPS